MTAHYKPANDAAATFVRRHIGPSPRDISAMLETVGAKSLDALMRETLPSSIRQKAPLNFGTALSETEALAHMSELAARNQVFTSLIGQGYSGTILPAVIQRNILESPAWYTAYTPYQPEISQGRLEALFNFQTMICDLTGLDVANASLLDEATAAAEAGAAARPRRTVGVGFDRRRSRPRSRPGGGVWRAAAISGHLGRGTRPASRDRSTARKGRAGRRRRRSAGADAFGLARRARRRYRDRFGAAFWGADGIWRSACGLYGGARRPETLAARPHRRAVDRLSGAARVSAGG